MLKLLPFALLLVSLTASAHPAKLYAWKEIPGVQRDLARTGRELQQLEANLLLIEECAEAAQGVHVLNLEVSAISEVLVSLQADVRAGTYVVDAAAIQRYSAMIRYIGGRMQQAMVPVMACTKKTGGPPRI